jgi:hypothetical protein
MVLIRGVVIESLEAYYDSRIRQGSMGRSDAGRYA